MAGFFFLISNGHQECPFTRRPPRRNVYKVTTRPFRVMIQSWSANYINLSMA